MWASVEHLHLGKEAGFQHVSLDKATVALVVKHLPDCYRLGGEAAIRECNDQVSTRFEHTADLPDNFHRMGEILDRYEYAAPSNEASGYGMRVFSLRFWTRYSVSCGLRSNSRRLIPMPTTRE